MTYKPRTAHVQIRYEQISQGKFTPTSENCGDVLENILSVRDRIASKMELIGHRDDQRNPQLVVRLVIDVPVDSAEEAAWFASQEWVPTAEREVEPMEAFIPGAMRATYRDGKIEKLWFSPAASDAGYRGGSFVIESGGESYPDEEDDRPFWFAMGDFLSGNYTIEWEG